MKGAHKVARKFKVLVGESTPLLTGDRMSKALASESIHTSLINDSSVYALMSRAGKVITRTRAIMANRGLLIESENTKSAFRLRLIVSKFWLN